MAATLSISILADAKRARDEIDGTSSSLAGLDRAASRSGANIGDTFAGIGKAALAVGAAAVVGLGAIGVSAFNAAEESAKIGRETERVIKTTGSAANVTAQQVADLAGSLSSVTGVDDEVIQSSANLLLTFTNVKNVVGDGNDVFNQAVGLAGDMATALGTDSSSAAIQLGKALNDPIRGITALSRSGVSFTEDQKEQIRVLQESGDTLGAQKIILGELSKEFGGAAAAASTPLDHLKVSVGNAQEAIGAKLIPVVDSIASWFSDKLPGALDTVMGKFDEWGRWITDTGLPALHNLSDWLNDHIVPAIKGVTDSELAKWFTENNGPMITFGIIVASVLVPAFAAWAISAGSAALSTAAAVAPIILATAAIAGLVLGIVWAYNNITLFHDVVNTVKDVLLDLWNNALVPAGNYLKDVFVAIWRDRLIPIWNTLQTEVLPGLMAALTQLWQNLQPVLNFVRENSDAFKALVIVVGIAIGVFVALGVGMVAVAGVMIGVLVAAMAGVTLALGALFAAGYRIVQWCWDLLVAAKDGVGAAASFIWDKVNAIVGFFGSLRDRLSFSGMFDGLSGAFRSAVNFVIAGWNSLHFGIPGFDVGPVHFAGFDVGVPRIQPLASGGIVTRPTLSLIGEAGPEAVIPLSRLGGTTHVTINVTSTGLGADSPQIARDVVAAVRNYERRNGPVFA